MVVKPVLTWSPKQGYNVSPTSENKPHIIIKATIMQSLKDVTLKLIKELTSEKKKDLSI